jgi:hypothetical protein
MPTWVKVATDAWTAAAAVADGFVFRPVNRAGKAQGVRLSEKVGGDVFATSLDRRLGALTAGGRTDETGVLGNAEAVPTGKAHRTN